LPASKWAKGARWRLKKEMEKRKKTLGQSVSVEGKYQVGVQRPFYVATMLEKMQAKCGALCLPPWLRTGS
jgi:hypothetical protein